MGTIWRQMPNALSLSRVLAAVAFLLIYSNSTPCAFAFAVGIALVALATDFLDGYLARRWNIASEFGYFLDGLGDKAFYFAVLIVMVSEGAAAQTLVWLLITREVVLYALRALDANRAVNLKRLRSLSLYHAFFIRLFFLWFFLTDSKLALGIAMPAALAYGVVFGCLAVVVGYATIVLQTRSIVRES